MIARPKPAAPNGGPRRVRVAIYCRQSVERETGGDFGSIEAQRDTVHAYVSSQKSNGWIALPEQYHDLGISGATTERPAYQRLLAEVEAGGVDVVAVSKFDRLSRSSRDFLNVLDFFEKHGVQFVSVTQHMDTSTPHGRFAMGLLIQVAQLEREVTAERVRDKIAASRRRGIWTGGAVPLGYRSVDKRLVIDEGAARTAREIVALYLETASLTGTLGVLRERGIVAKGGAPFTVATLRNLLRSPIIGGRIRAGDRVIRAQHEAILDEETWDALQAKLAGPQATVPRRRRSPSGALLANLVRCGRCGATWSHHWTGKANGRRFAAYVCQSIFRRGAKACPGSRAPAAGLEAFVVEKVRAVGRDPDVLREAVTAAGGELKKERDALAAQVKRLEAEANRLKAEQAGLVDTISQAGRAVPELVARLDSLRGEVEGAEADLRQARGELASLKRQAIDEVELRHAIQSFDGVWEHLFPAERQRIMALLIERVTVTVSDEGEETTIKYSAEGARRLLTETKEAS